MHCAKKIEFFNIELLQILVFLGALAQLVECNNGIVEVNGSIPLCSKKFLKNI